MITKIDKTLTKEVKTDKEKTKEMPCPGCGRAVVVTLFASVRGAVCSKCKSGAVVVPTPGKTDPKTVKDLRETVTVKGFKDQICPVDRGHGAMTVMSVSHSDQYGPSEYVGLRSGIPAYKQLAVGETVLHQCAHCKATSTVSNTAQVHLIPQNERRKGCHVNGNITDLGFEVETLKEQS